MVDTSIPPEPLNKLVWAINKRSLSLTKVDVLEDYEGENNNTQTYYSQRSPVVLSNPYTTGENVNLVERYLSEVLIFFKDEKERDICLFIRQLKHPKLK